MGLFFVTTTDGRPKPSVWLWLALMVAILLGSAYLVFWSGTPGLNQAKGTQGAQQAAPIQKTESKDTSELDAESRRGYEEQIARETDEGGGYLDENRRREIYEKYVQEGRAREAAAFDSTGEARLKDFNRPEPTPPPKTEDGVATGPEGPRRYLTLKERLEAEGIEGGGGAGSGKGAEFASPQGGPGAEVAVARKVAEDRAKAKAGGTNVTTSSGRGVAFSGKVANLLPLGTFLACVLDGDVVTTDLQSNVWATLVLDSTFRRQLQLPKGLVKLRGKTGREPVQNVVDIAFDVMVFSDGTELPITATAYAAFDPRYPNRFKTRGIPGEMIVPPFYTKMQSLLYTAALGASDAFIQNYVNENTETQSTFNTVPVIDPVTGQLTSQIQQQQGQPVNNNIGATIGLSAGQAMLEQVVEDAQKDLEKYRPYVQIEKGTAFWVQIDETVDVARREVNGKAIADASRAQNGATGGPVARPPGDARAAYQPPTANEGIEATIARRAAALGITPSQVQTATGTGRTPSTTTVVEQPVVGLDAGSSLEEAIQQSLQTTRQ